MNDLAEYFSDKDEIVRLNKQIDMIADFYKVQIKKLNKRVNVYHATKWKDKKRIEKFKLANVSTVKALLRLNHKKIISVTVQDIAKEAFVTQKTVWEVKKELSL